LTVLAVGSCFILSGFSRKSIEYRSADSSDIFKCDRTSDRSARYKGRVLPTISTEDQ